MSDNILSLNGRDKAIFEEDMFDNAIAEMRKKGSWNRAELVDLFNKMLLEFYHKETGKFLDNRM